MENSSRSLSPSLNDLPLTLPGFYYDQRKGCVGLDGMVVDGSSGVRPTGGRVGNASTREVVRRTTLVF